MSINIQDIFKEVKQLPIEDIIGRRIPLRKKGQYYYGICPFHNDSSEGSFVVTPKKGIWKCFSCEDGKPGDSIDFVSKYQNVTLPEAALIIAREYSIISEEEYSSLSKSKIGKAYSVQRKPMKRKINPTEIINEPDKLNVVFSEFIKICGLKKEDKEYLTKRGVPKNLLHDFFSMPDSKSKVAKALIKKLEELNYDESILEHTPGFYYDKNYQCWSFLKCEGIGMAIRDFEGKAIGIQIRKTHTEDKKSRYIWFASSFADGEDDKDKGTGSGSPIDVVYPTSKWNKKIAITEGKFKAIALSALGYIAVSTQGTTSWEKAGKTALEIKEKPFPDATFEIAFDSDFIENAAVRNHILSLGKMLDKHASTKVILWDGVYGKGFDDVYLATGENNIMRKEFKEFERTISEIMDYSEERLQNEADYPLELFKGSDIEKLQSSVIKSRLINISF